MSIVPIANESPMQIEDLLAQLSKNGYFYIPNIEEGFDHFAFLQRFWKIRPQYDERPIWNIKADRRFDGIYHSLNTESLYPHTEYYEREGIPHHYQALWCIVPAQCGGGQTLIADGYAFLSSLTKEQRQYLFTHSFEFHCAAGIKSDGFNFKAVHPMLEVTNAGTYVFRFSYNNVDLKGDSLMKEIADGALRFFDDNKASIDYKRNSLLVWDNFRMLHSRTSFTDRRRELRRVFLD